MGMYTGLRFKVIVKPEYRDYIEKISEYYEWILYDKLPMLEKWFEFDRHDFIPWGDLCYMPDEWDDEYEEHGHSTFNKETGEWRVICSLKNYNNEIGWFLNNILVELIESSEYIEYLYEEWEEPENYVLSSVGIVKVLNKGEQEMSSSYHDSKQAQAGTENLLIQKFLSPLPLNYGNLIEVDGHEYVVLKNEDGKAYLSYWMTPDKRVKDLEDKVEMLEKRIKRIENEL